MFKSKLFSWIILILCVLGVFITLKARSNGFIDTMLDTEKLPKFLNFLRKEKK